MEQTRRLKKGDIVRMHDKMLHRKYPFYPGYDYSKILWKVVCRRAYTCIITPLIPSEFYLVYGKDTDGTEFVSTVPERRFLHVSMYEDMLFKTSVNSNCLEGDKL